MGRCSTAPVAARSVSPPNPPRITLKNERFVPLHMMQERIASEEPTSAPVMMSASPAGGWTSTRSPNPLSHHRSSLVSAPVASISVVPSHGIPRSGAVGRHAHERRGRVLRHSARSSIAAHPKQTASWTHAHDHRRKVASCAAGLSAWVHAAADPRALHLSCSLPQRRLATLWCAIQSGSSSNPSPGSAGARTMPSPSGSG